MTATTVRPICGKRDGSIPCTDPAVVRYAVGYACSRHQLPGAEIYEWITDPAVLEHVDTDRMVQVLEQVATAPYGPPLPNPARPAAAAHVDAAPGEANAARLVAYKAGTIRHRVLAHLIQAGPRGTTAIEAWEWYRARYSPMTERYSVAPRLSELVTDGWAVKTGATRNVRGPGYPPEEIYVLSQRGRQQKGLIW